MLNTEGGAQNATDQDRVVRAKDTFFHHGNLGLTIDVDKCIVKVNEHQSTAYQRDVMDRLYEHLGHAVTFLTNNTGKTVSAMYPNIPCRSEFGMVHRAVGQNPVITLPDGTVPLNIEAVTQYVGTRANETRFMPKEASLCFNFYSDPEQRVAEGMAAQIMDEFNLQSKNYEMLTLVDSVEIMPIGVRKADCIPDIASTPAFQGKHNVVIGDSGTDYEGMAMTGFGVAVGNEIPNSDCVIGRVQSYQQTWILLPNILNKLDANQPFQMRDVLPTIDVNRKYSALTAR